MATSRTLRIAALSAVSLGLVAAGPEILPVPALPRGNAPTGAIPEGILEAARRSSRWPLPERMKAVSEPMLGRPYARDPLGEGEGPDPDPRARYDAFDCLTFVEETLALALSADPSHAALIRRQLRYGDRQPSYATRRHFMELQWIPGNIADGFLVSTADRYGEVERRERDLYPEVWRRWGSRRLFKLRDEEFPIGTMQLDILPLETAIEVAENIAPGSLVLEVHHDRPGVPIWTTHVGFVIEGADQKLFRNASRRSAMRVRDEPLVEYLRHIRSYDGWPVSGIAVFEPVEQLPRQIDAAG
jgi:hypothetical protein